MSRSDDRSKSVSNRGGSEQRPLNRQDDNQESSPPNVDQSTNIFYRPLARNQSYQGAQIGQENLNDHPLNRQFSYQNIVELLAGSGNQASNGTGRDGDGQIQENVRRNIHDDLNIENIDILENELRRSTNAGRAQNRGFLPNFDRNDSSIQRFGGSSYQLVTSSRQEERTHGRPEGRATSVSHHGGAQPLTERNLTLSRML
jgi:hypothetical protein